MTGVIPVPVVQQCSAYDPFERAALRPQSWQSKSLSIKLNYNRLDHTYDPPQVPGRQFKWRQNVKPYFSLW